jgi:carotenoid 1,2-hydratase
VRLEIAAAPPRVAAASQPLAFDAAVAANGYHWWYLDAISDDGLSGLTIIAFVGSVFSPYYALARSRAASVPAENHCALNVALYSLGSGDRRRPSGWAMTERAANALDRNASVLAIGPSSLEWQHDRLRIAIDELTFPRLTRLRGAVQVWPHALAHRTVTLDAAGRHRWRPIAPSARVELDFGTPSLRWSGHGYLDSNAGDEALEQGFECWHWSRMFQRGPSGRPGDGDTIVFYDAVQKGGAAVPLGFVFDRHAVDQALEPSSNVTLPPTAWRIHRQTRQVNGAAEAVRVLQTLEDTPFYARSLLQTTRQGRALTAMHESLSFARFRRRWVHALLPFRMPRRARWNAVRGAARDARGG